MIRAGHASQVGTSGGPDGGPPARRDSSALLRRRSPLRGVEPVAAGAAAAVLLGAAIYLGSGRLRTFDLALAGYATGSVVLVLGAVYRSALWIRRPPARRALVRGVQAVFSWRNVRRSPTLVPRVVAANLLFQSFILRRGLGRWLAHQGLFWGVTLASAVAFPLTFGWVSFRASPGTESGYGVHLFGRRVGTFDALSWVGWLAFHALDVASVLVIGGAVYFLQRRIRTREARLAPGLLPLLALLAISVTGLLLTVSSSLFGGRGYEGLALLHMATVVLTLVWIPFGKLFHAVQRPVGAGVQVHKRASLEGEGAFPCRRCGAAIEAAAFVRDLQDVVTDLGLGLAGWIETCPRCKRVERGAAYRDQVKAGFS